MRQRLRALAGGVLPADARERRHVLTVLAVALAVVGWGIWRVHHQSVFYDEVGSVDTAMQLLDELFVADFSKGGNLHVRLVWLAALLATPYWLASGQAGIVYNWQGYHSVTTPARMAARADATVLARLVSVLAAVVVVYCVYRLARHHGSHRAGLLAGVAALLSMGLVTVGKMGTEDMLVTALMMAAVLAGTFAVARGDWQYVNGMAVVVGLAVAAKATGGLLFVPLYVTVWLLAREGGPSWPRLAGRVGVYHLVAGYGYFAGTPSALRYPVDWLNRMIEMWTQTTNGWATYQYLSPAWEVALAHTALMLGLPLLVLAAVSVVWVHGRGRTTGRSLWVLASFLVVYVLLVTVVTMPQYYRVLPLVPIAAVYVGLFADGVWAYPERHVRTAGRVMLAAVAVFSLVYAGGAVVDWNTTRLQASNDLPRHLEAGDSVATISQALYWPTYPEGVEVRKYHDDLLANASARQHASTQIRQHCSDYVVLNRFQYHRYVRDPTTHPGVTDLVRWLFTSGGWRVVAHWGPPVALADGARWKLTQSWTVNYYANSVGNEPITLLESRAPAADTCDPQP